MSILNSIAGTNSKASSKWTDDEKVKYFEGLCSGLTGQALADHVGRPATGFNHRNKNLAKMFEDAGLTEDSTQQDAIDVIRGTYDPNKVDQQEEVFEEDEIDQAV